MEMTFGPLHGEGCRADLTLDDGRLFVINMTGEGVIMDLFDGPEDGDPKTIGMTYDEWAEYVSELRDADDDFVEKTPAVRFPTWVVSFR